ncbi:MAG: hypothetical protein HC828_22060 [Blastochloris sp.]|nr:hypothetical protein [Blastochloris sp.]
MLIVGIIILWAVFSFQPGEPLFLFNGLASLLMGIMYTFFYDRIMAMRQRGRKRKNDQ